VHPDTKLIPVWRGIAGLLALGFTMYALALLGAAIADRAIADRAIALLFAAAVGFAAIPCWWFALRGLAKVQRFLLGFLAILLTVYALPVVWSSLAHRSAGGLLLGARDCHHRNPVLALRVSREQLCS
jgi:hypothetical protein